MKHSTSIVIDQKSVKDSKESTEKGALKSNDIKLKDIIGIEKIKPFFPEATNYDVGINAPAIKDFLPGFKGTGSLYVYHDPKYWPGGVKAGHNALNYACINGLKDVISILLSNGANPCAMSKAYSYDQDGVIEDLDDEDKEKFPILEAFRYCDPVTFKLMLDHINKQDLTIPIKGYHEYKHMSEEFKKITQMTFFDTFITSYGKKEQYVDFKSLDYYFATGLRNVMKNDNKSANPNIKVFFAYAYDVVSANPKEILETATVNLQTVQYDFSKISLHIGKLPRHIQHQFFIHCRMAKLELMEEEALKEVVKERMQMKKTNQTSSSNTAKAITTSFNSAIEKQNADTAATVSNSTTNISTVASAITLNPSTSSTTNTATSTTLTSLADTQKTIFL